MLREPMEVQRGVERALARGNSTETVLRIEAATAKNLLNAPPFRTLFPTKVFVSTEALAMELLA